MSNTAINVPKLDVIIPRARGITQAEFLALHSTITVPSNRDADLSLFTHFRPLVESKLAQEDAATGVYFYTITAFIHTAAGQPFHGDIEFTVGDRHIVYLVPDQLKMDQSKIDIILFGEIGVGVEVKTISSVVTVEFDINKCRLHDIPVPHFFNYGGIIAGRGKGCDIDQETRDPIIGNRISRSIWRSPDQNAGVVVRYASLNNSYNSSRDAIFLDNDPGKPFAIVELREPEAIHQGNKLVENPVEPSQ